MADKLVKVTAMAGLPTVNTDITLGFERGDCILHTATNNVYVCIANTAGAANWVLANSYRQQQGLALSLTQAAPVVGTWYNFGGALISNLDVGIWHLELTSSWELELNIGAGMAVMAVEVALSTSVVPGTGIVNGYALSCVDDAAAGLIYRGTASLQREILAVGGENVYVHGRVIALVGAPTAANLTLLGDDVLANALSVGVTKRRIG